MSNPHGTPVWYELLTPDHAASKRFYDAVVGWDVQGRAPGEMGGDMDYRMIRAGDGEDVGGVMELTDAMKSGGSKPGWLFYIGVDDVDATADRLSAAGGAVLMPPFDLEGVGRMALVGDPQGIPFYVMRGASDQNSTAFERMGMGRCNWNELATPDQAAANAFYSDIFGWSYPDKMEMPGDMGDYVFVQAGDQTIGATMTANVHQPGGWLFYFRAPDIDEAAEQVLKGGGQVHAGPMDVPGGDRIIVASDPHGVMFGVSAPGSLGDR